ncbi:hypothetical protein DFH07DRAFT_784520 [Mycena maculata]|uniref:Uncharacterized protein n=1 Tax=Mycena maculata TaxID=230809 RepID=A0AAD7HHJ5_9AGAR|nr:hypothetical protein DFH07DRAFT_784520 [Mycena maculata]
MSPSQAQPSRAIKKVVRVRKWVSRQYLSTTLLFSPTSSLPALEPHVPATTSRYFKMVSIHLPIHSILWIVLPCSHEVIFVVSVSTARSHSLPQLLWGFLPHEGPLFTFSWLVRSGESLEGPQRGSMVHPIIFPRDLVLMACCAVVLLFPVQLAPHVHWPSVETCFQVMQYSPWARLLVLVITRPDPLLGMSSLCTRLIAAHPGCHLIVLLALLAPRKKLPLPFNLPLPFSAYTCSAYIVHQDGRHFGLTEAIG